MAYNAKQAKENRAYYLKNGRCPRCGGKNDVEPGTARCRECAIKEGERLRARKERRIAAGLCTRCGGPLSGDGKKMCKACREYNDRFREKGAKAAKKLYNERKEAGKCVRCGVSWAEPGKTCCKRCQADHVRWQQNYDPGWHKKYQRRQERIASGLCIDCGRISEDGKQRCPRCIEMRRESTRKYKIMRRIQREAEKAREKACTTGSYR